METKEKCPYCGKEETVIGKQIGYGAIKPNKNISLKEQPIYHVVCLNCGNIIRSYIEKPNELIIK